MNKINIIYWSGTGNTTSMAELIAVGVEEAGGEAILRRVSDVGPEEIKKENIFALGCPAMGAEELEDTEMEPFMESIEGSLSGKQVALFGSYGWGGGEWMQLWEERIASAGASVVGGAGIIAQGEPDAEVKERCISLGRELASL